MRKVFSYFIEPDLVVFIRTHSVIVNVEIQILMKAVQFIEIKNQVYGWTISFYRKIQQGDRNLCAGSICAVVIEDRLRGTHAIYVVTFVFEENVAGVPAPNHAVYRV